MKGIGPYNPGLSGKQGLIDALDQAERVALPQALAEPMAMLREAIKALPVPPATLDHAPACREELYAFKAHGRYVDWLKAKFGNAKIVQIHHSKSAPMPVIELGSGGYLGYNFFFYAVAMTVAAYARLTNLPRHGVLHCGEFQSSFGWTAEYGEVIIECDIDCVDEMIMRRAIY